MSLSRRAGGRPRLAARAARATSIVAVAFAIGVGVTAMAGAATAPTAVTSTVASGPSQSLGEPAAAGDSAVSAVVATKFGSSGAALAVVWTRRAGSGSWREAGPVLPAGFGSSYDASAAAPAGGPLLVVAGTSPGGSCIQGGSVAIANVYSSGRLGPARLVSDQRGSGSYDDRPVVAVGTGGMVWVAWSQGRDRDACQNVGVGDRIEVAVSHDGGRTFGAPVAMPADGGNSAFGARLVALGGGRVAVSWMERMGSGEAVLVSVLGPGGQVSQPQQVLTGGTVPLALPGASFYDFPAGDVTALPGGSLVVAAPLWRHGHSVIGVAAGTPGGQWLTSSVTPPSGADLLLPALGPLTSGSARLVCAVHTRAGDRVGYDWADVLVSARANPSVPAGLAALTWSPPGPGFFEIGEEMSIAQTPSGLLSSMVVAGSGGATLETKSWTAPRPAAPSPSAGTPSARATSAGSHGRPDRTQTTKRAGPAASPAGTWSSPATWIAVVFIACAALLAAWVARQSRRPHRPGRARHG